MTPLATLVATTLLFAPLCPAQVTGHFSLEKSTYAPGEPIFLTFTATNESSIPQSMGNASPYCLGMSVSLSSDPGRNNSCATLWGAYSCLSSDVTLAPGQSRSERLLINFDHTLPTSGPVEVDATKNLLTSPIIDNLSSLRPTATIHHVLRFTIGEAAPIPASTFAPFVAQLDSPDPLVSQEAARVLATLAPTSLESLLLTFPTRPNARQFAPLALGNLNTPRSTAALAEMLVTNQPGSYEHMEAAKHLAQTHDPVWLPLLRQIAFDHAAIGTYAVDAAEVGGDQAVPMLQEFELMPDQRWAATSGLGYTGSRSAIPPLLVLLRDPDKNVASAASSALQRLTHLHPEDSNLTATATYALWTGWWNRSGDSAPIYKPEECGELQPLR